MTKRAAIYARVSTTNGQTPSNQIGRLREVAEKAGWEIVEEFVDRGISGAKGRDKRPAFDRLCKAATRREIDVVMAWSVDRLGRVWSKNSNALNYRGLRTGRARLNCAVRGF